MTLEPGDLVRPRELAESRERLAELGFFRSVEVRPEARPGEPQVRDIVVNVATRPDVTVEYGLRYSTEGSGGAGSATSTPAGGRLQVAGGVDLANPLGRGWRVRGYTLLTTDRQTWGVNLDSASFFGLRLRSQLLVYDDSDQDIEIEGVASRVKGVTFQQTRTLRRDLSDRRWHDRLRLQWGYTFKDVVYVEDLRARAEPHREPRVPERVAHRRRARQPDRPAPRRLLDRDHRARARTSSARTPTTSASTARRSSTCRSSGRLVWAQGYRARRRAGRRTRRCSSRTASAPAAPPPCAASSRTRSAR